MSKIKLPKLARVEGFKAYDIRARVPDQLEPTLAYRIGLAFAQWGKLRTVAVGRDIRPSSLALSNAVINGLTDAGVEVVDVGLCGSENVYFATAHYQLDGGIMITASHNPVEYNGMKLVIAGGVPVGLESGLADIRDIVAAGEFTLAEVAGSCRPIVFIGDYINHILRMVDVDSIKPLHVLADVGHGGAGTVIEELCRFLPVQITGLGMTPDGNFPLGVPNPMLKEQQSRTGAAVLTAGADFGVSWDGDFDRCFFFDEHGNYIDPYYITGLFAEVFLVSQPHSNIVHDIRLAWHSVESIEGAGGVSCPSKSGHAYMKTTMRQCDAIYGGETTGHHYFKDFYYCDSGIIPFLLMLAVLSSTDMTLSQLIAKGRTDFPCSGEINLPLQVAAHEIIERVRTHYRPSAIEENDLDGLSMSFDRWRFNVRGSNTEPLLRINVESRADEALLKEKCDELLALIAS